VTGVGRRQPVVWGTVRDSQSTLWGGSKGLVPKGYQGCSRLCSFTEPVDTIPAA
jgi:hypothetical protein